MGNRILLFFSLSIFYALNLSAQSNAVPLPKPEQLRFTENKGQWDERISFQTEISNGKLLVEKNAFYFILYSSRDLAKIEHPGTHEQVIVNGHSFREEFVGANLNTVLSGENAFSDYSNYYIGNNPQRWASGAKIYSQVNYSEIYTGIDLRIYTKKYRQLKYDWIVKPNADVSKIKIRYTGIQELQIVNYDLRVKTSVGEVVEEKPFAYQEENGFKKKVKCNFVSANGEVSFEFPEGYNRNLPLIIDPTIVFST